VAQTAAKKEMQIFVFAHNARGYDSHFIMKDLFERKFVDQPKITMNGLKVLKIDINNVHFIDSLSFFQQPLASLPKSFGFQNVVQKGFFPHLFNREENYQYEGNIPDIEYFEPQSMKSSSAQACKEWHQSYVGTWNFQEQLKKYCKQDVDILTIAVMKFREQFKSITELDPITRNFTLASVAMEHFRSSVLKKDDIGITPIGGYIQKRNQSQKANIWLDWINSQKEGKLLKEQKIGPYYLDGYIPEENHVFEFFGCYYHGCETCYTIDNTNRYEILTQFNKSFHDLYRETSIKVCF
jgi:hypothetical protein